MTVSDSFLSVVQEPAVGVKYADGLCVAVVQVVLAVNYAEPARAVDIGLKSFLQLYDFNPGDYVFH